MSVKEELRTQLSPKHVLNMNKGLTVGSKGERCMWRGRRAESCVKEHSNI